MVGRPRSATTDFATPSSDNARETRITRIEDSPPERLYSQNVAISAHKSKRMRTDVDILSDYTDFSRCYRVHCPYKIIPIDSIHARISPVNGVIDRPDDVFETVGRRERERGSFRSFLPVPSPRSKWIALSIDFEIRNCEGKGKLIEANEPNFIITFSRRISKQFCLFEKRPTCRLFAHLVYSSTVYATD